MSVTTNKPVAISDANFEQEVIQSDTPVLVDFWAEWCGPCRALTPVIESLSDEYSGRAKIAKMDVDANQQTAMKFGIRSIPTVMLFNKGEVVDSFIGVRPKTDYAASIDRLID